MAIKFSNNATTTLDIDITTADTQIVVAAGTGTLFPTLGAGEYFLITIQDLVGDYEIVKVTTRAADTLTVTRAQEGTTARAFVKGSIVESRLTAGSITEILSTVPVFATNAEANTGTSTTTMVNPVNVKYVLDTQWAGRFDTSFDSNVTAFAKTILDDTSATQTRSTLGCGTAATYDVGPGATQVPTNSMVGASPKVAAAVNMFITTNFGSL